MKSRLRSFGITAVVIVAVSCLAPMRIGAQQSQTPAAHPPQGSHNFAGQSDSPPRDQIEAMLATQMAAVHTFPHAGLYGRRRLAAKARQGILLLMLR